MFCSVVLRVIPMEAREQIELFDCAEIHALRIEMGLTYNQFGLLIGVGHTTVQNWEAGKCSPSEIHNLRLKIAKVLWVEQNPEFVRNIERLHCVKGGKIVEQVKALKLDGLPNALVGIYYRRKANR